MPIRSFISIPLPVQILQEFEKMISFLKLETEGVKWVSPKSIHLTLKFLGNLSLTERDKVIAQLDQFFLTPDAPFSLTVSGAGVFPNARNPKVFWIGVQGHDMSKLEKLQAGIDAQMTAIGFEREKRKFRPHLTIGRAKQIKNMPLLLEKFQNYSFASCKLRVEQVHLMKSDLKPTGAEYSVQKTYNLK